MIRITEADFAKLVAKLGKEGQPGAVLSFVTTDRTLQVSTVDRNGKDLMIEITDSRWPMMPRITKTETF